ncbi:MAG: pentapeptide repeat-containing protein [Pleurocapsa sp. MO_226.B13]|nr:pentapeptide repeat-containing protein [Pleurocapsa sp. MO_226.B13]
MFRSIPEELIRIKAKKIWMERQSKGIDGTAEGDWNRARQYFKKHPWEVLWWKFRKQLNKPGKLIGKIFRKGIKTFWKLLSFPFKLLWKFLTFPFWLFAEPLGRDFALEIVKTLISAFGLVATIFAGVGLFITYQDSQEDRKDAQRDRELTQERLVTDRFSKAVEQLGKEKDTTVRIGGIYALEGISKQYDNYFWTIMEVLTSYVRENSSLPPEIKQNPQNEEEREQRIKELRNLPEVKIDIQAALTVIRRSEDPEPGRDERIDLSLTNLKDADLGGADLSGANLGNVNLSGADLSGANLGNVNLSGANLGNVNLGNVNLSGADLGGADLSSADLSGANLSGANLSGANLRGANLRGANLRGANLRGANLDGADLSSADLSSVFLSGADLSSADLSSADLSSAFLSGANLDGADLSSADLSSAFLSGADLRGADLSSADLRGADLRDAFLRDADLRGAFLGDAYLIGADLSSADLRGANLRGADLGGAYLINTRNLAPIQIKSACFWEEAIYEGERNIEKQAYVAIEPDNTNYIEELKKDTASDPSQPPDCSRWQK